MPSRIWQTLLVVLIGAACVVPVSAARPREIWERYTVALIGKHAADPTSGAVRRGAEDAARKLDLEYHLETTVILLRAPGGGLTSQNASLEQAFLDEVDGVIINVAENANVDEKINFLTRNGIPVVTVENDAPASSRIATVQTDDAALGKAAFEQAAGSLSAWDRKLAVLAGDTSDHRIQTRLRAVQSAADSNAKVEIREVLSCPETLDGAVAVIRAATSSDRDEEIDGWLFLGPWPLLGVAEMPWASGSRTCVAVDALPPMLRYLANGEVDALIAQQYYQWGYLAMETLLKSIHLREPPAEDSMTTGVDIVTRDNLAEYTRRWADWMQ